jgi:hypothetical protein
MVVFCPGCGAKISAEPRPGATTVTCPRCRSTFSTAGLKSAPDAPAPQRFRKKKSPRGKLAGVGILLLVLLLLGGGTAAVLYFTGLLGRWTGSAGGVSGPGGTPTATAPTWLDYVSAEGKFRVLFPGAPTRETIPPPGRSKSAKPRVVFFTAEAADVKYSVAYEDFDQSGPGADTPEQFIQKQHNQLAGGRGGKLLDEKDVALGPHKGKELMVEVPGEGTARIRFFAAGRRLYKLTALGKTHPPDPGETAKFFDSFQITE